MKRILWICGRLPSPLYSGDALYSAGLLRALAETHEAAITLVGTRRYDEPIGHHILDLPNLVCVDVAPAHSSGLQSLLSPLPRDAFNLGTPQLQRALEGLLAKDWDWLVVDHAYSSGLLSAITRNRRRASLCYIAHNAEGIIRTQIANGFSNPLRQLLMRIDAEKYRKQEAKILQATDAVLCISEEDQSYFQRFTSATHVVPPIYTGPISPFRPILPTTPRAVLMVGSFEWVAKQRNLELIVEGLLPGLHRNGIRLDVVGAVPKHLRDRFDRFRSHLLFHGQVPDLTTHLLSARGGLVPDLLGGGFKLKVLDYAFQRLPIFGLRNALSGTTAEEKSVMFLADNLSDLADVIARNIDDLATLERSQAALFDLFAARFGVGAGIDRLKGIFLQA